MRPAQNSTSPAVSGGSRLRLRRNPIGLVFSASPWRSAGYLASYLIGGSVLFAVALSTSLIALVLGITVAALPLLVAAAAVIRGCASVQRYMLRQVFTEPVRAQYPAPQGQGLWKQARARWGEGTTWRDLGCLLGLWPIMFVLATAAFTVWLVSLAGVTLPLWYSHVADVCVGYCGVQHAPGVMIGDYPQGPHGPVSHGLYVNSLPHAFIAAGGSAVLFLLFTYVLVAAAQLNGRVIRAVLRRPSDPLGPAMDVLTRPGPLGPLVNPPAGGLSVGGPPDQ
jgi:hypothetical protein